MIKFKTKEEGILKINDLLLQGYSKDDLLGIFGINVKTKQVYNPILDNYSTMYIYNFNGKELPIHSKEWSWKEKLILKELTHHG